MLSEETPKKVYGESTRQCRRCGTHRAVIRRYGLLYCRRCFVEVAKTLGFEKYS
ncbi:MAG: 30S ribosomal protein S14 [Candidatus Heimdallarchaeota archaeon]|nr:30S ribosomal protein S14 [Candidatus Heimdallarchaeota archaeon]